MANRPSMSSEALERQKEARGALAKDVDEALQAFMKTLNDIAMMHGRCVAPFFQTSCTTLASWVGL